MSSDISRQRFKPGNNFSSVLMQQGRVQLDVDWNEWNEILDRRWRSETIDIIGRGVVPRETPDGFAIAISGASLTIGRGRIYVDGLQAENHGAGDWAFDVILAESRGVQPTPYDQQPYFPHATPLPKVAGPHVGPVEQESEASFSTLREVAPRSTDQLPHFLDLTPVSNGPHLVYLDVWEREVTVVEDAGLREVALGGPDTTSRLQTVWQVRVLPNVGEAATCGMPDEQLVGWLDLIRPSAGRLTTSAVGGVATPTDPCLIPPSGGYRGLENRTYRVEVHNGGALGTATFKWSRDNASVATNISRIEGNKLTVDRTAWDSVRRFNDGDWVEITDDWREFSLAPGEIRQIAKVDDAGRTIILAALLTAGLFPVDGEHLTAPERHTRIKRWDQSGIPIPPAGTPLILEDGVEVTFTINPAGGEFRSGDYWIFAARTADASVEKLEAAPPRGVHHHYCRLALVTFPDVVLDCRIFWPPLFEAEGQSCDCSLCVTAEQHNSGAFTIYEAVNQLLKTGGTICLGPGIFNLVEKSVQLDGAFAVRIRGQGAATVIIQPPAVAAFIISRSQWCTLDYLTIHTAGETAVGPSIRLGDSVGTTIERLIIGPPTTEGNGPPVGLSLEPGFLAMTKIRDNFIWAQTGVTFAHEAKTTGSSAEAGATSDVATGRSVAPKQAPTTAPVVERALVLSAFYCEDNVMRCSNTGVRLDQGSYYLNATLIARNLIYDSEIAGIVATGFAAPELNVTGNFITPIKGDGIIIGTGGARISENEIANSGQEAQQGIRLVAGVSQVGLASIVISGNRLVGLRGNGLAIETLLTSALIEHNLFKAIEESGIIMLPGSSAQSSSSR